MKTKAKIIISVIAVCVIIGVVVLSMVIALTEPVYNVDNSKIYVEYDAGEVSADISIKKEDTRLYHSQGEGDSVTKDVSAEQDFTISLNHDAGSIGGFDLGMFNLGQFIDKTQAETILTIDVSMNALEAGKDTFVKLLYSDKGEKDYNVKLTISAIMYKDGKSDLDLGVMEYKVTDGVWNINNNVLFNANQPLTRYTDREYYSGVRITVKSELVSFTDNCRLDGDFTLSLTA